MVQLIRLKHHALQHAGFTGRQSFVKNRSVTSEGISQVAGVPPLLQHVLKVISFLQHWVSVLERQEHHMPALESDIIHISSLDHSSHKCLKISVY